MSDFIDWPANRGTYRYWFLDSPRVPSSIKAIAGNYMFVKQVQNGWVPVYIGIADDLSNRLPSHERWADALAAGATRVMAHTNLNPDVRAAEEADLIGYWNPPLNTQHRTTAKKTFG